jgi:hypothetical protein
VETLFSRLLPTVTEKPTPYFEGSGAGALPGVIIKSKAVYRIAKITSFLCISY